MFEKLTARMEEFRGMGIPGCDCIVYQGGKEVYRHFCGYSDREAKIPMNGEERYNIYSCSKPITCVAALQLFEKGCFGLDDELWHYLPEFKDMAVRTENGLVPAKNRITIRNLFTMTAGLDYCITSPAIRKVYDQTHGACPTRETIRHIASMPLSFEPGAQWQYSLCHDVIGALIEVVSGMEFNAYLTKNIFQPLGMDRTTFLIPAAEQDSLAAQYRRFPESDAICRVGSENCFRLGSDYASGGAGAASTVNDYIKFLEALRSGETLLKRSTINLLQTHQLNEEQYATSWGENRYGYGLGVRCPLPSGNRTDFGWGGWAGAYLAVDLALDLTMFYAQHVLGAPNVAERGNLIQDVK